MVRGRFRMVKKKKIIIYPTNWVRHVRSRQLAENPMRVCVCLGIFFRAHNLPASLSTPSVWRKNQTNDGTVRGVTSPGREEKKKSRKQTRAKSHTKGEKYGANGKKCRDKKCPYTGGRRGMRRFVSSVTNSGKWFMNTFAVRGVIRANTFTRDEIVFKKSDRK